MGRKNSKKKNKDGKEKLHQHSIKGVLDITRSGMGFVIAEGMEVDILVRPTDFNT
ncbi:MAG: hypothetical protein RL115_707, partial [Bacteroidota bacterium]